MPRPDPLSFTPSDPRFRQIFVATFASDPERARMQEKMERSWPHIRPDSVYIAAMGNHWGARSWSRVADLMMHTSQQGYATWLVEHQDRNFNPFDAMGVMRNEAAIDALMAGFEWILYLDNDVLPNKDYLIRLLQWDVSIVAPMVVENETNRQLSGPGLQANTGLQGAKWTVLSMLLMRTSVLRAVGMPAGAFWQDPMGADEGYHFKKLWGVGHRPYIDTTMPLRVDGRPHYPLATNRMSYEDRTRFWEAKLDQLQRPPDRRPEDPYSSMVDENGEYMPFTFAPIMPGAPQPSPEEAVAIAAAQQSGGDGLVDVTVAALANGSRDGLVDMQVPAPATTGTEPVSAPPQPGAAPVSAPPLSPLGLTLLDIEGLRPSPHAEVTAP